MFSTSKTYVVLCILDILLSYYMFTCGLSYEENPIARFLWEHMNIWGFVMIKCASICSLILIGKITHKEIIIYRCANIITGCVVVYSTYLCSMIMLPYIGTYIFILKHKLGLLGG